MDKSLKCILGIHKWKESTTFSNAVPLSVRHELGSNMMICTRCFKVKKVKCK